MNVHVAPRAPGTSTIAGEGFPRRAFTVADVFRMIEAGVIGASERFELISGEILPMSPEGAPHLKAKMRVNRFLVSATTETVNVMPDATLYLADDTFVEPDFYLWPAAVPIERLRGVDLHLVVELADSSLGRDLKLKSAIYAANLVPEYWVVDLPARTVVVHRSPDQTGYHQVTRHAASETLTPLSLPELAFRLADHLDPL